MEKDNKKKEKKDKIMSFKITEDMLSDSELDLFLKESLIREADEIEKALNEEESLRGVGASDDLFQSIVDKLKEQGVWEEEQESEQDAPTPVLQPESEEQDAIYSMLSEEDRLNIEAGKKYRMQEELRRKKRAKRAKIIKRGSMAAAAIAVVFGLSMTSDANRRLMLKAWDGLMFNLNYRLSTNYVEEESVRSKTKEEIEALEDIRKKLGAAVVEFAYLPKKVKYEGYDILEHGKGAYIFYSWGDTIISVAITHVSSTNQDGSFYSVFDQTADCVDTIRNEQDIEIHILETDQELEMPIYVAEVQYNGFRYIINGISSLEELIKVAEYCIFL